MNCVDADITAKNSTTHDQSGPGSIDPVIILFKTHDMHFLCVLILYSTELLEVELTICIKMDLALNNLQRLIYHKTQPTNYPLQYSDVPVV